MIEIERKFLVHDLESCLASVKKTIPIFQGYLSDDPERTVRIRIADQRAFLTVKGAASSVGISRFEWEHEIPLLEAQALLPLCLPGAIRKNRHHVVVRQQLFEVDVFEDALSGLVLAEIELKSTAQKIDLPDWIGKEVTGDKRYYNSHLAAHGLPR